MNLKDCNQLCCCEPLINKCDRPGFDSQFTGFEVEDILLRTRYLQLKELVTDNVNLLGKIVLYIGETIKDSYILGYFYKYLLNSETNTYEWVNIMVLPNPVLNSPPNINDFTEEDVGNIFLYVGETTTDEFNKKWVQGWFYIVIKNEQNNIDIIPINVQDTDSTNYLYNVSEDNIADSVENIKTVRLGLDFLFNEVFYRDTKAIINIFNALGTNISNNRYEHGTTVHMGKIQWNYFLGKSNLRSQTLFKGSENLNINLTETDKNDECDIKNTNTRYALLYTYKLKNGLVSKTQEVSTNLVFVNYMFHGSSTIEISDVRTLSKAVEFSLNFTATLSAGEDYYYIAIPENYCIDSFMSKSGSQEAGLFKASKPFKVLDGSGTDYYNHNYILYTWKLGSPFASTEHYEVKLKLK